MSEKTDCQGIEGELQERDLIIIKTLALLFMLYGLYGVYGIVLYLTFDPMSFVLNFDILCIPIGWGLYKKMSLFRKIAIVYLVFMSLTYLLAIKSIFIQDLQSEQFYGFLLSPGGAIGAFSLSTVICILATLFLFRGEMVKLYFIDHKYDRPAVIYILIVFLIVFLGLVVTSSFEKLP